MQENQERHSDGAQADTREVGAQEEARRRDYRQGFMVLVGLAVLTGLEFMIATALGGSTVFLFILALAKAGIILQYYMHVDRLWSEEEAH